MKQLKLKIFELGSLSTNCYLIYSTITKKCFLIDAADGIEEVTRFIIEQKLKLEFVILTHGHFDHIGGLDSLKSPFYVHTHDAPLLTDAHFNGSAFFGPPIAARQAPILLSDAAEVAFEQSMLRILHTPGHTPGSISILFDTWLFSGDTIFLDSVGRTDIPMGSHKTLVKSIKEKIFTLPDDTVIYPGHGPATSVAGEKANNPYVK
jgi:hydroxyacylglutathione hydrolase